MANGPIIAAAPANKTCLGCGGTVSKHSTTGFCRSCVFKVPEIAARRSAAIERAFMADPSKRERQRNGVAEANRRPEARERARRQALSMRIWEQGVAAMTPEIRERCGATLSARKLAHIPLERRAEYKRLVKYHGAAEAERIVLAHHEVALRRGFV